MPRDAYVGPTKPKKNRWIGMFWKTQEDRSSSAPQLGRVEVWVRQESLGKGEVTAETFRRDLAGNQSRPAELASSRERVLRGAGVTRAAKRRQRVSGPCH